MKHISKSILSVAVSATLVATAALAETNLQPVLDASQQITSSATQSQQKIDKIADQVQEKLQQYRTVNKETEGLNVYNSQLEKQIANQLEEMKQLNLDIDRVSVIERQITPLMIRMIDGLEQFVSLDVPFLPEERKERIAGLKDMMVQADVAVSEKFRRVLEAYQVEVGYGRTIEAYSGLLEVEGQERDVDFLRIGRVALMYMTRDGSYLGRWNAEQNEWAALDQEYRMHITKGLRMAKKQLAPDLLTMPIQAAP
jgi:DNA repair exonuclease SbcCD ATPase subunit